MSNIYNVSDEISFSDLFKLSELKLNEISELSPLINDIYNKRHILKSVGIDIQFKGKSITELYS